jgi:FMN reductase
MGVKFQIEGEQEMDEDIAVVVGNPKPKSKTLDAAENISELLFPSEKPTIIDLAELSPGLLEYGDKLVERAVERVCNAKYAIFASPTYKASYTGLLKLFLDRLPHDGLQYVIAVPMMIGGTSRHALAADLLLKPVLEELGASCPTRGLFLLESEYTSGEVLENWLVRSRKRLFEK